MGFFRNGENPYKGSIREALRRSYAGGLATGGMHSVRRDEPPAESVPLAGWTDDQLRSAYLDHKFEYYRCVYERRGLCSLQHRVCVTF